MTRKELTRRIQAMTEAVQGGSLPISAAEPVALALDELFRENASLRADNERLRASAPAPVESRLVASDFAGFLCQECAAPVCIHIVQRLPPAEPPAAPVESAPPRPPCAHVEQTGLVGSTRGCADCGTVLGLPVESAPGAALQTFYAGPDTPEIRDLFAAAERLLRSAEESAPGAVVGSGGRIVLSEPARCPGCGRMAAFVVNRDGKTLCVECDERAPASPPAEPPAPPDDVACYCGAKRLPFSDRAEITSITGSDGVEHRKDQCIGPAAEPGTCPECVGGKVVNSGGAGPDTDCEACGGTGRRDTQHKEE